MHARGVAAFSVLYLGSIGRIGVEGVVVTGLSGVSGDLLVCGHDQKFLGAGVL